MRLFVDIVILLAYSMLYSRAFLFTPLFIAMAIIAYGMRPMVCIYLCEHCLSLGFESVETPQCMR